MYIILLLTPFSVFQLHISSPYTLPWTFARFNGLWQLLESEHVYSEWKTKTRVEQGSCIIKNLKCVGTEHRFTSGCFEWVKLSDTIDDCADASVFATARGWTYFMCKPNWNCFTLKKSWWSVNLLPIREPLLPITWMLPWRRSLLLRESLTCSTSDPGDRGTKFVVVDIKVLRKLFVPARHSKCRTAFSKCEERQYSLVLKLSLWMLEVMHRRRVTPSFLSFLFVMCNWCTIVFVMLREADFSELGVNVLREKWASC